MIENKDLDIYSYNYIELLQLFKIKDDFNNLNKIIMEKKIKMIKEKLTIDYYYFYLKAYKLIICIYYLYDKNIILNNDNEQIESYIKKIKNIDMFEKYEIIDILNELNISIPKNEQIEHTNSIENINKPILYSDNAPPQIQEQKYTNKTGNR